MLFRSAGPFHRNPHQVVDRLVRQHLEFAGPGGEFHGQEYHGKGREVGRHGRARTKPGLSLFETEAEFDWPIRQLERSRARLVEL